MPGKLKLSSVVALAYTLVIVYASLHPFTGWRSPPEEVLAFLGAPWPRYVTAGDVMLNVAAYLPLGAILYAALRPPLTGAAAIFAAILIASLLSLALESAQMFLPTRIASNLDLLTNVSGAGLGAIGAWLLAFPALANNPLAAVRRHAIRAGALGDVGLLVVALWILTLFHQAPLALGNGDLREALGIAPFFTHTPLSYLVTETSAVALAVVAISLLVSLLLSPGKSALPAIAGTLLLATAAKSIAAITIMRATHWLQWLTPGVAAGTGGAIVLLVVLLRMAPEMRAAFALLSIAAVVFIVNVAPENPYQPVPPFTFSPQPTHLLNFSQIVQAVSITWPLVAAIFLIAVARNNRAAVTP